MGSSTVGTSRRKAVVIMAAGLGTRMKSGLIKVLHPVAGRPMIHYSVRLGLQLGAERVVVVLGHQRERVEAYLRGAFEGEPLFFAEQPEPLGTAHAVSCAVPHLAGFDGDVYILSGDVPNLRAEALAPLADMPGAVRLIGMAPADPAQYGRLVREGGALARIVEFKDCTPAQRSIGEVNAGIYAVNSTFLFDTLGRLGRNNAQGEYYLTDLVQHAHQAGLGASAHVLVGDAAADVLGVNDRVERAEAEQRRQAHLRRRLMRAGVSFIDPVNPYVLTDRATKYALLFIVLTFVCVALTEVLARRRVHPVQYTLVGLALALFYLLLLSLSEHIAFGAAYAAASAACVGLLGFYARHMLGSARAGAAFGAGIALLYGALWSLLQMEQTALVIGSLLLFTMLAAVMVATRRVDWYALFDGLRRVPAAARPDTP